MFIKSRNLNISRKQLHIQNLQITCFKAIYNMFIFSKSEIFSDTHSGTIGESFRGNLLIKSRNPNILEKFKLNRNLQTIPFKMMYNMSMLRHRFSNERWGGGGGGRAPSTTFLSYSVKVCTKCPQKLRLILRLNFGTVHISITKLSVRSSSF